tara:strand:- start:89 stop:289 length:201 start_codon:yes stop_codon:yes gene_type:complete
MKVFELVHVKLPPPGLLVKEVIGTKSPSQTIILSGTIAEEDTDGKTLNGTTTLLVTQEFEGVPVTV